MHGRALRSLIESICCPSYGSILNSVPLQGEAPSNFQRNLGDPLKDGEAAAVNLVLLTCDHGTGPDMPSTSGEALIVDRPLHECVYDHFLSIITEA